MDTNYTDPSGLFQIDYNASFAFLDFSGQFYDSKSGFFPPHEFRLPTVSPTLIGGGLSYTQVKKPKCKPGATEVTLGWKNFGVSSDEQETYVKYSIGPSIGLPSIKNHIIGGSTSLENLAVTSSKMLSRLINNIAPIISDTINFIVRPLK